jgi:hypothetical protein
MVANRSDLSGFLTLKINALTMLALVRRLNSSPERSRILCWHRSDLVL